MVGATFITAIFFFSAAVLVSSEWTPAYYMFGLLIASLALMISGRGNAE